MFGINTIIGWSTEDVLRLMEYRVKNLFERSANAENKKRHFY